MRVKAVRFSDLMIWQMLATGWSTEKSGHLRCVVGLPAGAQFEYAYMSQDNRTLFAVFSHDSFDNVRAGEEIPLAEIVFEQSAVPDVFFLGDTRPPKDTPMCDLIASAKGVKP